MRELEPKLRDCTDEQVAIVREKIYQVAQLAYDSYKETNDSKFPLGSIKVDDNK